MTSRVALPQPASPARLALFDEYLDEQLDRRQGNKVLHGYPPPLLWRQRPVPVEEVLALRENTAGTIPKRLILYVATPYCLPTEPDRCGFCLFPSEVYRNRAQLDEYLDYLALEGRMFADRFAADRLEAIYFGGGTANLYQPYQFERLLDIVREVLGPIPAGVEVTLEGVPQLFTRVKLEAMQAAGINRISIGAQQLSDDLIRASGRRQTADQVLATIGWCRDLGLPANVDLIFGWPRQTAERMLRDLEIVVGTGIEHITHYELNLAGRTPFALELANELPSRAENLDMYRQAKRFLEGAGYRQRTAYDWQRTGGAPDAGYRFENSWHRPLRSGATDSTGGRTGGENGGEISGVDMWGWGYAGVSSFLGSPEDPGWTYINHTRIDEYFACLDAGRFPVDRGFHYDARSLRLNVLFQMLHGMSIDLGEYERLFGIDLLTEHRDAWCAVERRGWLEIRNERLELVGDGVFHTPLVQSLLARSSAPPRPGA